MLSAGASRLFLRGPMHIGVSSRAPPCVLSPATGAPGRHCSGVAGFQESKAESSRPLKGQAWNWHRVTASCWSESSQGRPGSAGVSRQVWSDGTDCWRPSSETEPTAPAHPCPGFLFASALQGFPRSLMFSFPNEFLVRLARACVQLGCLSSGEHPTSDTEVCPVSQGYGPSRRQCHGRCPLAGRSWSETRGLWARWALRSSSV